MDEDETRAADDVHAGARIAQFEILSLRGRGGMGRVYVAHDHRLDRKVAIKFLPAFRNSEPEPLRRFEREARAASALNHPNIVTIFDSGESPWGPYIVMELIQGRSLREVIAGGMPLHQVLDVGSQMAAAASVAHAAGIVHRDLKPDNILVRDDGYVKVVDFGLARLGELDTEVTGTTAPGVILGTLRYLSPEQGRGAVVDERSDVFALGLILYHMATGRHPFDGPSAVSILQAIALDQPMPPSVLNAGIPLELDDLILRMLQKEPADRPTALQVVEELRTMVNATDSLLVVVPSVLQSVPSPVVGRDAERELLTRTFEAAEAGRGTLVCITGEAGMGKSTLVQAFLSQLAAERRRCVVGSGRSSQRLAGSEAYAPLLEALADQLRADQTGRFAREMKQVAPSWYYLVVSSTDQSSTALAPRANSQARMRQELHALLQRYGRETPLVVVFEDFQWADVSTLDALVYLAERSTDLRLLLIVTCRESDLLQSDHPFVDARRNLRARELTRDIRLDVLSRDDVESLLGLEYPRNRFPPVLAEKIFERTGGHPLFVADLIRYLKESGGVRQDGDVWTLDASFEQIERELPESVRAMVERKMAGLSEEDRRLLTAAAVQGEDFDSAVVARMLAIDAADVEERLEVLDRVFALVVLVTEREMPDRTLTCRYRFAHAFYHDYCIGLLRPTRKASLYRVAALALHDFYGDQAHEVASELAMLFVAGRDFTRAGEYFLLASRNAALMFAHPESAAMARRGLEAVRSLPPSPDRDARELALQLALGGALCMTSGYANPLTVNCFSRALELATGLGAVAQAPQVWGLWMAYAISGDSVKSRELSDRLLSMSGQTPDPSFTAAAHYAAAITRESAGDIRGAREHIEAVLGQEPAATNRERVARFVLDPVIAAAGVHLRVLALLGRSAEARQRWEAMREYQDRGGLDPRSGCDILISGAVYHTLLRRPEDVSALAAAAIEICDRFDIYFERQWASFLRGWALTQAGDREAGLADMRAFLGLITAAGCLMHHSMFLTIFVEALLRASEFAEARHWIDRGFALVTQTGQRYFESELHRLDGEFNDRPGGDDHRSLAAVTAAVDIAVAQEAHLLEARAALSLAKVLRRRGDESRAVTVMTQSADRMPKGFESPEFFEMQQVLRRPS